MEWCEAANPRPTAPMPYRLSKTALAPSALQVLDYQSAAGVPRFTVKGPLYPRSCTAGAPLRGRSTSLASCSRCALASFQASCFPPSPSPRRHRPRKTGNESRVCAASFLFLLALLFFLLLLLLPLGLLLHLLQWLVLPPSLAVLRVLLKSQVHWPLSIVPALLEIDNDDDEDEDDNAAAAAERPNRSKLPDKLSLDPRPDPNRTRQSQSPWPTSTGSPACLAGTGTRDIITTSTRTGSATTADAVRTLLDLPPSSRRMRTEPPREKEEEEKKYATL